MLKALLGALLLSSLVLAQGPAAGTDPAVLARLLTRHRPVPNTPFDFAAIGDQQYGPAGEAKWPGLVSHINRASTGLRFIVHAGDVKSGSTVCDNAMFLNRVNSFNAFEIPMIITPGDNEWTDCHRANNGSFDSLERLAYLRTAFYPSNQSFGRTKLTLSQQSEDPRYSRYVENAMWSAGNVLFATVHIVGSNNNLGRNAANDLEWEERGNANFNWIKTVFSVARDAGFSGVVLVMQANPGWNGIPVKVTELETGFRDTFWVIEDETIVLNKPVLAIMGDSHYFRVDMPLIGNRSNNPLENFTRLEVPGSNLVHWVRVRVDPATPNLFSFRLELVPESMFPQSRP